MIKILIVEDEEPIANLIRMNLVKAGYQCETASDGETAELTTKEYELLLLFLRNKNRALYRETIYESVWGGEYTGTGRTVDLHVQRLKKKLRLEEHIRTIYKVGYRLEC